MSTPPHCGDPCRSARGAQKSQGGVQGGQLCHHGEQKICSVFLEVGASGCVAIISCHPPVQHSSRQHTRTSSGSQLPEQCPANHKGSVKSCKTCGVVDEQRSHQSQLKISQENPALVSAWVKSPGYTHRPFRLPPQGAHIGHSLEATAVFAAVWELCGWLAWFL